MAFLRGRAEWQAPLGRASFHAVHAAEDRAVVTCITREGDRWRSESRATVPLGGPCAAMTVHPSELYVVAAVGGDSCIVVAELLTGTPLALLWGSRCAVRADGVRTGRLLARLSVWECAAGALVQPLLLRAPPVFASCAVDPSGLFVVAAAGQREAASCCLSLFELATGRVVCERALPAPAPSIHVSFAHDSAHVYVTGRAASGADWGLVLRVPRRAFRAARAASTLARRMGPAAFWAKYPLEPRVPADDGELVADAIDDDLSALGADEALGEAGADEANIAVAAKPAQQGGDAAARVSQSFGAAAARLPSLPRLPSAVQLPASQEQPRAPSPPSPPPPSGAPAIASTATNTAPASTPADAKAAGVLPSPPAASSASVASPQADRLVTVRVERGEQLRDVERFGRQDPYVLVRPLGREAAAVRSKEHTDGGVAPRWEQTLEPLQLLAGEDRVSARQSASRVLRAETSPRRLKWW